MPTWTLRRGSNGHRSQIERKNRKIQKKQYNSTHRNMRYSRGLILTCWGRLGWFPSCWVCRFPRVVEERESLIMMLGWLGNGLLPCCTIIYDVGISFCTTVNLGLIANSDNKSNPKTTPNNIYTYKYLLRYCGYLTIPEIAREADYTKTQNNFFSYNIALFLFRKKYTINKHVCLNIRRTRLKKSFLT